MTDMQKQIEDLVAYVSDQEGSAPREPRGSRSPREALVKAASGQLGPFDLF